MIVDAHNDLLMELVHRRAEERPFERHWLPLLDRGGVGVQVCPIYTVGEEVLLFAARTEIGRWRTLGAGQGKFTLIRDPQGRSWVRNDFYRCELAQMSPDRTPGHGAPLEVFAGHVLAPLSSRRVNP